VTFTARAHRILDHSLYADKLLHGFNYGVLVEMILRPEFGPVSGSTAPAMLLAMPFLLASLLFTPGVLLGFSSDHLISRQEFFRVSGLNVWRFLRLMVVYAVIAGVVTGFLLSAGASLTKSVDRAANDDRLPYLIQMLSLVVVFLIMTMIRAWFDIAQTDVVLRDQSTVRKSVIWAFEVTRQNLGRLLVSYVLIAVAAKVVLFVGVFIWHAIVPPTSVLGAFVVSQAILLLLLAMRFWQRASAVAFYLSHTQDGTIEARNLSVIATATVYGL
jgi:hypothetical protein